MLKKRIAATLVVRDGIVVQSIGFKQYLPVGKPSIAIEFLNQWGIDEIMLLDISATKNNRQPDFALIKHSSTRCYVPLAVGGGITHVDHIKELMNCGADKVSLNQSAIHTPSLITEAALMFGNQCVIVSIDAVSTSSGYRIYDYLKRQVINITPAEFAKQAVEYGAGEILINSVDRDGSYEGYDIDLINEVCNAVTVPVIGCGGAKNAKDIIAVLQSTNAAAAAAGNFFHFTEHSVNTSKAIVNAEVPIRIEVNADYQNTMFDDNLRLIKKSDKELEQMLFLRIKKEII